MSRAAEAGPLARYQARLDAGHIDPDERQRELAAQLQTLFDRLDRQRSGLLRRLLKRHAPVPGLYIHGGVGRGKTLLMDLLADSLKTAGIDVWRIHFHRFMDGVHERLHQLGQTRDPLPAIAGEIAGRARVLCFDEFHVNDIGDAMVLGGLLQSLFARGLCLVATSNTAPDELYAGGLQRERFEPAIAAITQHCRIFRLDGDEDYRLRELTRHPVWYQPHNAGTRRQLAAEFERLAGGAEPSKKPLTIRGRRIEPVRRAGPVAWFDFDVLCRGPRASGDYIDLASRFGTLLVSDIPVLDGGEDDAARRLVHLIDECYDRSVKLIASAAAPPDKLYTGSRLAADFRRTASRLTEMQTRDYLARAHKS